MIKVHRLGMMGVVEAKVRPENMDHAVKRCFPHNWPFLHNASNDSVARIVMGWDPQLFTVDMIHSSSQLLVVKVLTTDQRMFYVSYVYGHNLMSVRRQLWMSNKRGGLGDRKSKLDRALISPTWLDKFPESETTFLPPGISDHCFILVDVLPEIPRKILFKFFSFWMNHANFKDELQKSWREPFRGSRRSQLYGKLVRLNPVLRAFNKKNFSDIGGRVDQARQELASIQEQSFQRPHDTAFIEEEKNLPTRFVELSSAEESFKKQKSRIQWLALGDHNTRFFHHKMKSHSLRSKILSLTDASGTRLTDPVEVKGEILGYYMGLLGTSFAQKVDASHVVSIAVAQRLPSDMKEALSKPVSSMEIKAAMWSIKGEKAPGPDGFSSDFFQKNWNVVGEEVVNAIQLFFQSGIMPRQWNCTALTLVPKTQSPNTIRDYRPIAYCNVVYNCVTKVLANRLQPLLPSLISPNQSAFVKGRLILDNILLMQEIVKNYHRENGKPRCAIKMDLMKAYDSVDWEFVLNIMKTMEFPSQFIHWVQVCITSPMYSVVINGELEGSSLEREGYDRGIHYLLTFFCLSWKVLRLFFSIVFTSVLNLFSTQDAGP
ncbi:hypothetical protein RHMOL_Rhmol04G0351900 [Rhododendron molle]|uniref:Uncharacterized protein n=1 Tax=Rhododendron molle TaxID=49168 RepID=A0ACC0P9A4_RHOML|nr:hypothetical protein RHMOL_Rhmol04G0351900 [Rhododendron molle]